MTAAARRRALPLQQRALLDWYARNGRRLLLRTLRDPYAIWIAETMSQQTQISRVDAALPAFLAAFPDLDRLAAAETGDVLRAWAGLGYHRRALSLRAAARRVRVEHRGMLPHSRVLLEQLPGLGPYTARAVAATAFGQAVTALDTNSTRVLARLLGHHPVGPGTRRSLQTLADEMAPEGDSAAWNHALMDLGASVCRTLPQCHACPLAAWCAYRQAGDTTDARAAAADGGGLSASVSMPALVPFKDTRRWARGRILQRLREEPVGAWVQLDAAVTGMSDERLEEAVLTLVRDSMIEVDAAGRVRLPRG